MTFLTATANRITLPPMLQKTAYGFDRPTGQNNGATAPSNLLGAFFVPRDFPLVVCGGNPSGLPVIAVGVHRSVNPSHAATILFDRFWCQLVLNQTLDTNMTQKVTAFMPEDCFKFNKHVDTTQLFDPTYLLLKRVQASLHLLQSNGEDLDEGFTLPHGMIFSVLDGLQADLASAIKLLELAEESEKDVN